MVQGGCENSEFFETEQASQKWDRKKITSWKVLKNVLNYEMRCSFWVISPIMIKCINNLNSYSKSYERMDLPWLASSDESWEIFSWNSKWSTGAPHWFFNTRIVCFRKKVKIWWPYSFGLAKTWSNAQRFTPCPKETCPKTPVSIFETETGTKDSDRDWKNLFTCDEKFSIENYVLKKIVCALTMKTYLLFINNNKFWFYQARSRLDNFLATSRNFESEIASSRKFWEEPLGQSMLEDARDLTVQKLDQDVKFGLLSEIIDEFKSYNAPVSQFFIGDIFGHLEMKK